MMAEEERISLRLARDRRIHPDVEKVGEALLRLCDRMIAWTVISKTDEDRQGQQLALAFYLGKIQRVTRLALTGILTGQGREAMPLLREQYDFMLRFEYYKDQPHEALLFALTQAATKVEFAKEVMSFDPVAVSNPRRIKQLKRLEADYSELLKQYPDLMRPTKKSASSRKPKMVPWSEPSTHELSRRLMKKWLDDRAKVQTDLLVPTERVEQYAARVYFMRATFQSQAKHGTAFNIADGIERNRLGNLKPVEGQLDDPNGLIWLFLQSVIPQIFGYKDVVLGSRGGDFDDALSLAVDDLEALRIALGIKREPEWS